MKREREREREKRDDEKIRVQLADRGTLSPPSGMRVRSMVGREGQHGARAELRVQGRRIWVLHLLAERRKGESIPVSFNSDLFESIISPSFFPTDDFWESEGEIYSSCNWNAKIRNDKYSIYDIRVILGLCSCTR